MAKRKKPEASTSELTDHAERDEKIGEIVVEAAPLDDDEDDDESDDDDPEDLDDDDLDDDE